MKNLFIKLVITLAPFITIVANAQIMCGYDLSKYDTTKSKYYKAEEERLYEQIREYILKNRQTKIQVDRVKKTKSEIKKGNAESSSTIPVVYVPVVFHIISEDPFSISDAAVQSALDDLNNAFAHQGLYGVDTLGADTRIQFKLAKKAPDGSKSNGINRIKSYYEVVDVDLEDGALKNLIKWDPGRYANIWVVKQINGEIQPSTFECGKWTRLGYGGYASAGGGVVVAGLNTAVVAHEMGHYLSLLHTFQGTNCLNNNCLTDGDQVCDTPPDRSTKASSCSDPENSCSTDTLSGPFKEDKRDNISNFMDYGSPCPTVFTPGQGERMRAFLSVFNGGSLLTSDGAATPCTDNINALYEITSNPYPVVGTQVGFKNISTGADRYEWFIKDNNTGAEALVSTAINLVYSFSKIGAFSVKLKAFNTAGSCTSSYYTQVIVNCGTVARFSPDKRLIASRNGIYEDTITFKNNSYNGDNFEWYVKNNTTNVLQMLSTDKNLKYSFPEPGSYSVWLKAAKGSCVSTSETFTFNVDEALSDGIIDLYSVNCYNNDSIRISFGIRNQGFDTIPAGTIIRFYDKPFDQPDRKELRTFFKTSEDILGKCAQSFEHIVKAERYRQDSIFLSLDEDNVIKEITKSNNKSQRFLFQPKQSISPGSVKVFVNSTQNLKLNYSPDPLKSIAWSSNIGNYTCTTCESTSIKILDTTYAKVKITTQYGCDDSANAIIIVYPNDLKIANQDIYCYKNNDSVLVASKLCLLNSYEKLKRDITVQYYDRPKTEPGAILLYEEIISSSTLFSAGCSNIVHTFKRGSANNIYTYFNPDLKIFEEVTNNNESSMPYKIFSIGVPEKNISVYRGEPNPLSIIQYGEPVDKILWSPKFALDCLGCFSPTLKTNSSTIVKVSAISKYGCRDSTEVAVSAFYRSHIALPNVFTPNGDGNNDYFYVIAGKDVSLVKQFTIMDRWGSVVFASSSKPPNDYSYGWNGMYNGKYAPEGTYIYQVTILLSNGSVESYKGNITIIR